MFMDNEYLVYKGLDFVLATQPLLQSLVPFPLRDLRGPRTPSTSDRYCSRNRGKQSGQAHDLTRNHLSRLCIRGDWPQLGESTIEKDYNRRSEEDIKL